VQIVRDGEIEGGDHVGGDGVELAGELAMEGKDGDAIDQAIDQVQIQFLVEAIQEGVDDAFHIETNEGIDFVPIEERRTTEKGDTILQERHDIFDVRGLEEEKVGHGIKASASGGLKETVLVGGEDGFKQEGIGRVHLAW